MYIGYFVNVKTGELKRTSTPKDDPVDEGVTGWKRISEDEFFLFKLVGSRMILEHQKTFNNPYGDK